MVTSRETAIKNSILQEKSSKNPLGQAKTTSLTILNKQAKTDQLNLNDINELTEHAEIGRGLQSPHPFRSASANAQEINSFIVQSTTRVSVCEAASASSYLIPFRQKDKFQMAM